MRYYIDGPHDGSERPLGFSSSTFSHYYRPRFEIRNPDGGFVVSEDTYTLSVFFVPFSGEDSVCLVRIEPMSAFETSNKKRSAHTHWLLRG